MAKNNKTQAVTIYDVAKEASVSLATVSRVLNNSAVVRPERRTRVEDAIKKLNFKPNEIARGLARKSSTSIGVIVSDINRASVSELLAGIIDTANLKQYAYAVTINAYMGEEEVFLSQIDHMVSSQVDGLLIMCDYITAAMHKKMQETPVPIVVFATPHEYKDLYTIAINYSKVATDVASYFAGQNYENILFLTRSDSDEVDLISSSFYAVCEGKGLKTEHMSMQDDYVKTYNMFFEYYKNNKLPNGVFAVSDSMALAFSNAVQDLGNKVPEDVEIISFSNTQAAVMGRPQLTSVMYPIYRIGAYAMSAITKFIKNEEIEQVQVDLENDYQIIWRQSTRK
ncbi:MAG: LacI family DNA-binding transcriptional regulator [Culicoidibacterales bacterium]